MKPKTYAGWVLLYSRYEGIWVACKPWEGKFLYFATRTNAQQHLKNLKKKA